MDSRPKGLRHPDDEGKEWPLGRCPPKFGEWQDISTAPRDGTKIDLLYPEPRGRTIDCWWDDQLKGWFWRQPMWINGRLKPEHEWLLCNYPNMEPTHWMLSPPLPPPPEE